jgi:hypothetical protein
VSTPNPRLAYGKIATLLRDRFGLTITRGGVVRHPSGLAPSYVWGMLAAECADLEAVSLFPELHRAYDDGLIETIKDRTTGIALPMRWPGHLARSALPLSV